MPEVAALPVQELRLPLLAPSELATLESHNQRDLLIPVSCRLSAGCPSSPPRGWTVLQGRVWGPLRCGHADAPIPVPIPVGGEHRGGLAVPRAAEGQWGALPPLPAPPRHAAPRPPPAPGPARQIGAGVPPPPSLTGGGGLGQWQCPPAGRSAVGQAVGLGAAGGAAAARSMSAALCPMPGLRGQGRMPGGTPKRGAGTGGRGVGAGPRGRCEDAQGVTLGVVGLQGPLREGGTG